MADDRDEFLKNLRGIDDSWGNKSVEYRMSEKGVERKEHSGGGGGCLIVPAVITAGGVVAAIVGHKYGIPV